MTVDGHHERRERLVELLFECYVPSMPTGEPVPARELWPAEFVDAMAETPPVRDLDRRIEFGARALTHQTAAEWQGWTS